jgi:ArsR family transcriptional regulator
MRICDFLKGQITMLPSFELEIHQLHSQLCAGLADPNRILLLYALSEEDLNVTGLSRVLSLPQPKVSRHLKMLRERGLVVGQRKGQSVYYKVADTRIIDALDLLRAVLADLLANQVSLAQSIGEVTSSLDE